MKDELLAYKTNSEQLKSMERLVIHLSKSKAWMAQRTDGCAICKQIHSNNGLGLAVAAWEQTGAATLVKGSDNSGFGVSGEHHGTKTGKIGRAAPTTPPSSQSLGRVACFLRMSAG